MLHYLACAAIAYFLARYLNSRFPGFVTAVWSGGVATIVGMTVGSGIVLGGMAAMGFSIDAGVIASRAFGQAFLFLLLVPLPAFTTVGKKRPPENMARYQASP